MLCQNCCDMLPDLVNQEKNVSDAVGFCQLQVKKVKLPPSSIPKGIFTVLLRLVKMISDVGCDLIDLKEMWDSGLGEDWRYPWQFLN